MEQNFEQNEDSKHLAPGFLDGLKRFSNILNFIHAVALMRFYQKSFFKEKENANDKRQYLEKSREYERIVDQLIEKLWPDGQKTIKQTKLF
jgi:hypothetical protein